MSREDLFKCVRHLLLSYFVIIPTMNMASYPVFKFVGIRMAGPLPSWLVILLLVNISIEFMGIMFMNRNNQEKSEWGCKFPPFYRHNFLLF